MPAKKQPEQRICEVCKQPVDSEDQLCGCEECGRLFGPCCNSEQDSMCVECV